MKKLALVVAVALGGALFARRAMRGCHDFDFERMIERMPENAPPKWIFRNISEIRRNTDRILEVLEAERGPAAGEEARTAA